MKRGRPSIRLLMHKTLISILSESKIPLTISGLARSASRKLERNISWNTVQKYIQELVELDKVKPILLPHSKIEGRDGLTVYTLKK